MKRSCSAPSLVDKDESKKLKITDKTNNESMEPNSREYLQLALARVLELQRAISDDSYFNDHTSDLGESDTDEDIMKEVLTKVFKDLPGSSSAVTSIINCATHPTPRELTRIRAKSIQLSGYDRCRRVAVDFMKNVVKYTPKYEGHNSQLLLQINHDLDIGRSHEIETEERRKTVSNEYELRTRMLKSLDLHLADKQRDYTLKLMRL